MIVLRIPIITYLSNPECNISYSEVLVSTFQSTAFRAAFRRQPGDAPARYSPGATVFTTSLRTLYAEKTCLTVVLCRRESNVSIFGGHYRRGLRGVLPAHPGGLTLGNDIAKTQISWIRRVADQAVCHNPMGYSPPGHVPREQSLSQGGSPASLTAHEIFSPDYFCRSALD